MIIVLLTVLGLCLGSFVNALVWRLHEQETQAGKPRSDKKYLSRLSIARGRSMCPHCKHELAGKDLVPVLSWLSLKGRCRYCHRSISWQYPLVELATAGLFVVSYIWWPLPVTGVQMAIFGLWLVLVVGLMALLVYDLLWLLLPNRIMYPLSFVAGLYTFLGLVTAAKPFTALISLFLAVGVGGGIFYVLFQISGGRWIGGGDVKLGWLLGLVVATPAKAFLLIFAAALGGSLVSLPLLAAGKLKRASVIPFGPFLIAGALIVVLFGTDLVDWYQRLVLMIY